MSTSSNISFALLITHIPCTFSHPLSTKLSSTNYLHWKQEVVVAIKGNQMFPYILGINTMPFEFLSNSDEVTGKVNGEYETWVQYD